MPDTAPPHVIAGATLNLARLRHHRAELERLILDEDPSKPFVPMDLAVTLRVWCQDSRTSHSLVKQLGIKSSLTPPDGTEHLADQHATGISMGQIYGRAHRNRPFIVDRIRFASPLHPEADAVPFIDWWLGTVLALGDGVSLNRQQVVASWANKFGGAHTDPDEPEVGAWSLAGGLGLQTWVSPAPRRPGQSPEFTMTVCSVRPGPKWMALKEDSAAWSMSAAVLERIASELIVGLESLDIDGLLVN